MFAAFGGVGGLLAPARRLLLPLSVAWLLFALFLDMGQHFQPLWTLVPAWIGRIVYPIDKTNLDVLRLLHFLALAYVVHLAVPMNAAWLRWRVAEPLRRCGEQSLQVFCLGTFLSFTAHVATERYEQAAWAQIAASVVGILLMVAFAYAARWYKHGEASTGRSRVLATGAVDG